MVFDELLSAILTINQIDILSVIIVLLMFYIARAITVVPHELAHWVVGGFKGKIEFKWFPWISGKAGETTYSSDDSILKKFYDILTFEAGCIINMLFAVTVILLLPRPDLNNWFHVFIFSIGFMGLMGTAMNLLYGGDHTAIFEIFGIRNFIVRLIIGLVIALALIYLFREYYVVNLSQLISNLQKSNFNIQFIL